MEHKVYINFFINIFNENKIDYITIVYNILILLYVRTTDPHKIWFYIIKYGVSKIEF
jgi:hypothetical protein